MTADAIDATGCPELANRYRVHGVPRTIINESVHIEGAVPETMLMAELIPILEQTVAARINVVPGRTLVQWTGVTMVT